MEDMPTEDDFTKFLRDTVNHAGKEGVGANLPPQRFTPSMIPRTLDGKIQMAESFLKMTQKPESQKKIRTFMLCLLKEKKKDMERDLMELDARIVEVEGHLG